MTTARQPLLELLISLYDRQPALVLVLHAIGNFAIVLFYCSLPQVLEDCLGPAKIPLRNRFTIFTLLSALLIFLCGLGHILALWSLWYPGRWLLSLEQTAIAFLCVSGVWIVWQVRSQFLSLKADLQSGESRWQTLTNALPMGVAYIDRQGRYQFVNDNYATGFDLHRDTTLGQFVCDLLEPQTYAAISGEIDRVLAGNSVRYETQIASSTQGTRDLENLLVPDFDDRGQVRGFYAFVREIGDRKATVARLRLLERAIEVASNGISIADARQPDFPLVYVNSGFAAMTGYTAREIIGKNCRFLQGSDTEQPELARVRQALREGNPCQVTLQNYRRDGIPFSNQLSLTPVRDETDTLTHFIGIQTDISHRLAIEEQLRQKNLALSQANADLEAAREAAETANRAKSEFLATMSHELRTPLNVILGFSEILTRETQFNGEQQQILSTILRSGEHLLSLINDILDLAKIEAGKIELIATTFNLDRLLAGVIEMLEVKANRKGLTLNLQIAPEVPVRVEADEAKLRQILINLLGNAVKFTQTGSVTLRARVVTGFDRARPKNLQFLELEVRDTGVGIESDELERIFQAFDRGRAGWQTGEGTGLGLAICQNFIKRMGGRIEIESLVGVGTIVRCSLPVKIVEGVSEEKATVRVRQILGLAPDQPPYRILIVEDRWENRHLLVKLLQPIGFETLEAENGQEAIELWEQHHPHLILMDMRMPVMDGYEAVRRIRSSVAGHAVAIIALTASAFDADKNLLLSAGCNDFATKPIRQNDLLEKIADQLGVRYRYQETTPTSDSSEAEGTTLTPESFAVMPRDWVERLNFLAGTLDREEIGDAIAEIPAIHNPFQRQLEKLVEESHFDTIYHLTQTFLKTPSATEN